MSSGLGTKSLANYAHRGTHLPGYFLEQTFEERLSVDFGKNFVSRAPASCGEVECAQCERSLQTNKLKVKTARSEYPRAGTEDNKYALRVGRLGALTF